MSRSYWHMRGQRNTRNSQNRQDQQIPQPQAPPAPQAPVLQAQASQASASQARQVPQSQLAQRMQEAMGDLQAILQASQAFQTRQAPQAPQAPQAQAPQVAQDQQPPQAPQAQQPQADQQREQWAQLQQVPEDTVLLRASNDPDTAAEDGQDGQNGQEAGALHEPDGQNVPPPPPPPPRPSEGIAREARSVIWINQITREDGTVFDDSVAPAPWGFQRPGHPEYMVDWMPVGSATVCPVIYWLQYPYPDWNGAPVDALDLEFRRVRALYPPNVTLYGVIFRGRWARLYREMRPWAVGVDAPIPDTLLVQESLDINMKEEAGLQLFAAWRYSLPENARRKCKLNLCDAKKM
ncbi:hypothetical protein ASPACDRAFT_1859018 [Aspergillus aculeatus ATCC 16872]|uniref:Uncharacterized protein n=1 Tax=Aspergillus aculeatus (strain ATCC 16872 / CBS 172.66 / WB 5094) TaxID=690307 RepID=A0A1L9WLA8_ASPA1|nr:uncharacterized protein ASPACDRAFT_1859018 [Aspergillus aculeatus ATCC 16872]OJJ96930.1 hypothetical protein ASPACDRAFT_1859018 [Aspergillus aculeatus ATCC 16872]